MGKFKFLKQLDMNKVNLQIFQVDNTNKKGEKEYDSEIGSKTGGFYTLCGIFILFGYFIHLVMVMNSANNDLVSMKKLIIDFNSNETDADDITKYFSNYTLLPTMDIETAGGGN